MTREENLIPNLASENIQELSQCDILLEMSQKLRKDEAPFSEVVIDESVITDANMVPLKPIVNIAPKSQDPKTQSPHIGSTISMNALGILFTPKDDTNMGEETQKKTNTNYIKEINLLKQRVSELSSKLNLQSNLMKNIKRKYTRRESVIKKLRKDLSDLRRERRKLRQREYMRKFKQKKMAEKRKDRRIWICQQIQSGKLDKSSLSSVYSSKSFEKLKEAIEKNNPTNNHADTCTTINTIIRTVDQTYEVVHTNIQ